MVRPQSPITSVAIRKPENIVDKESAVVFDSTLLALATVNS